jgi:hypothetical protein
MCERCDGTAAQIQHSERQECDVYQRYTPENERTDPAPTQQVSKSKSREKRDPEGDLAGHNQRIQRTFTEAHRSFTSVSYDHIDQAPNEIEISDGYRERTPIEAEVF